VRSQTKRMQRETASPLLRFVIGGGIGTLIGLCFLKVALWLIPLGTVAGGLLGLSTMIASSDPAQRGAAEDVANLGCQGLGCLLEIWLSSGCIGCWTFLLSVLTVFVIGIFHLVVG
jgi:hypothetical protein